MLSFKLFLLERIVNLGFSEHGNREQYAPTIHDIIRTSYKHIGGYLGLGHGTQAESDAIYGDIHHPDHAIKMYRHNGIIKAAVIYRMSNQYNRKLIAAGTDRSPEGIHGLKNEILRSDNKMKRAWGEFSGKMEELVADWNPIPPKTVQQITGKPNIPVGSKGSKGSKGSNKYLRRIGDKYIIKSARGYL